MNEPLLNSAASVRTVEEFKSWSKTYLRPILPHGALICGWGHLHAGGTGLDYIVSVDCPIEYFTEIRNRAGGIDTPILRRWLEVQEPLMFEEQDPWPDIPIKWIESFRRYQLVNVVAHALLDTESCVGTYHSLYRIPGTPTQHHLNVLKSLVPVMHDMLCRVIDHYQSEDPFATRLAALTERERTVLHWLGMGKTNTEIALLTTMRENTVKHHLTNIFDKLGVTNRTRLVRYLAEHEIQQISGYRTKML